MNLTLRAFSASALLCLAACSQPAPPPVSEGLWTVDGADSTFSFVTVKAGDVVEAHSFGTVTGSVGADGAATIEIGLSSLDTGVEVRDERMRAVLFEVETYPEAKVTAQLDPATFADLGVGDSITTPVKATLDLHGMQSEIDADLEVARLGPDKVLVTTTKPIIVDAGTFGLGEGVEKLRELANLPSITPAVPVSFTLLFTR